MGRGSHGRAARPRRTTVKSVIAPSIWIEAAETHHLPAIPDGKSPDRRTPPVGWARQDAPGCERRSHGQPKDPCAARPPLTRRLHEGRERRMTPQEEENLANFDRVDFEGWNGPDWD